jgi:cellulose biosynthesis protein BcsQ
VNDGEDKTDKDDLSMHIVDKGMGSFDDLIRTVDAGFDVIPSHNRLSELDNFLDSMAQQERSIRQDPDYTFPRHEQLFDTLEENNVSDRYDVLIIDPNAKADDNFTSAIYATRNIVMPVEPSGKGAASVQGLRDIVDNLNQRMGIDIGVLAAVPNDINNQATDDSYYVEQLQESTYDVPAVLNNRRSLFRGSWRAQCTAFEYVENERDRERDRELKTLMKIERIARHVSNTAGITVDETAAETLLDAPQAARVGGE